MLGQLVAKLQALPRPWKLNLSDDAAGRLVRATAIIVVGVGILLRTRGLVFAAPGNSMWLDEAVWAMKLIEDPLSESLIRPIAFMASIKALISVLGAYPVLFRLLPWLAGVATCLMLIPLARRLFRSDAARLLFVSILALLPSAIDLSRDFKPYALGLAFHVGMLLLALRYRDTGQKRDLIAACAVIVPSVLFSQDVIFAYPSLFLFMAAVAIRAKRLRHVAGIAAAAVATLSIIGGLYFFVWNKIESKSEKQFWGEKYDVFYLKKNNPEGKADWFIRHYITLAESLGERREVWNDRLPEKNRRDLSYVDRALWLALHAAGLSLLVRGRKLSKALLLAGPIIVMSIFNLKGIWPFGHFRTNLFVVVYLAGIAAVAVDRRAERTRMWDLLPATVMVLLPLLLFEKTWHSRKEAYWVAAASWVEQGAGELVTLHARSPNDRRELLVTDHHAFHTLRYYTTFDPSTKDTLGTELSKRFGTPALIGNPKKMFKEIRKALDRGDERAWMLIGSDLIIKKIDRTWPRDLEQFETIRLGDGAQMVVGVRKRAAEATAAR